MNRWRVIVVVSLIAVPILGWAGVGSYYLWSIGWGFWAWWLMMSMVALGYFLAWHWQRNRQLLQPPDFEVPPQWTERDRQAFRLVENRAKNAEQLPVEKLGDVSLYLQTAQDMAQELARFYHPDAVDPIDYLTVPELLSVMELAAHDMRKLVDEHLPGGHLLTVRDWKRARQIQQWYQTGSNLWWAVAACFNPIETGLRYAAAQAGISAPLRLLQQNLFLWFYTAFIQRLGHYLIDLNSGRLRVGAERYRELLAQFKEQQRHSPTTLEKQSVGPFPSESNVDRDAAEQVQEVSITLLGQVKAGKSSLVNALLGEQRAITGVVPTTSGVERYELISPGIPTRLILHDTPGYAHAGPRADQLEATAQAARQSDLLFLVLHARNPGRQADLAMLDQLSAWFADRPELRPPPVIAVLTHIDLLSPMMEWSPPYSWTNGTRTKEVNIREAITTVREQFGERLVSVVPVCTEFSKEFGIDEALLPAVANWLDEIRGVAFLRALRAEVDRDRIRRIFRQLLATGKLAAEQLWQGTGS